MAFYNPIILTHKKNPIIVYPEEGIEKVLNEDGRILVPRNDSESIKRIYDGLEIKYTADNNYIISFLWKNDGDLISDIWRFNHRWNSGPLAETYIYDAKQPSFKESQENLLLLGTGSGNTLIVLGREEEARRSLEYITKEKNPTLKEEDLLNLYMEKYIRAESRPKIPFNLMNGKNYFL